MKLILLTAKTVKLPTSLNRDSQPHTKTPQVRWRITCVVAVDAGVNWACLREREYLLSKYS